MDGVTVRVREWLAGVACVVPDVAVQDFWAISSWIMLLLEVKFQEMEVVAVTVMVVGSRPTSAELRVLQDFGLVIQTLAGLSGFYERVQDQVEKSGPADLPAAAKGVTLERLRERLLSPGGLQNA